MVLILVHLILLTFMYLTTYVLDWIDRILQSESLNQLQMVLFCTPSKFSSIFSSNIIISALDVDNLVHHINSLCTSILDKVAPLKSRIKRSENLSSWITDDILLKENAGE